MLPAISLGKSGIFCLESGNHGKRCLNDVSKVKAMNRGSGINIESVFS